MAHFIPQRKEPEGSWGWGLVELEGTNLNFNSKKLDVYSMLTPWRNGSASDSRSEGCVFKSRRGQFVIVTATFWR